MAGFPDNYADPLYDKLDSANEQKLGLPVGLLSSIRTKGEKSNHSQVSEASAKSVYQIIPATREAAIKQYGIDPLLSPENASEVAARLLADSLKRNGGDATQAVGEYIGGTNRKNWGKTTNAYIGRVMSGQQASKVSALLAGFAKFMQENPAQGTTPAPAAAKASPSPALDAGFGQWISNGGQLPQEPGNPQLAGVPSMDDLGPKQRAPEVPRSIGEKIVGAGEAALTLATGATAGTIGMAGGTIKGLAGAVMDGTFGTQEGARQVEKQAAAGMKAMTYAPRGEAGQEYAAGLGEAGAALIPLAGLSAEMGAASRAAGNAGQAAMNTGIPAAAANTVTRIRAAAPLVADRLERTLRRNPEPQGQRAGGSVGAQGQQVADMRRQSAESLPVPIDLTRGQATREQMQVQFERETAKAEAGAPLRDRYAEQNEKILQNFDAWVDQTGAEAPSLRAVGQAVDTAVKTKATRDKVQIRVAYKEAERAGEMEGPVTLAGLVEHLNESAPDAATAPLLNVARQRAIQLGIAAEGEGGQLVPLQTTLKDAERMRQAIGRATDYEATNIRQSAIIKSEIDAATEGAGGQAYKAARRLRENFAKQYEDRAVVSSLLNNKRGMGDRKIALEDVFSETILKGSLDDVRHVRRVLQTGGEAGSQAWRELQGATMNWLKEESIKNVATDSLGNTIVSPAQLNKSIRQLDVDGKLDFVFGKKGGEQMRDLNEIVKVIHTVPPGSVNFSNTASVILNALGAGSAEAAIVGLLTGLPIPVLTGAKLLAARSKNIRLQKRIAAALERRPRTPPAPPQF